MESLPTPRDLEPKWDEIVMKTNELLGAYPEGSFTASAVEIVDEVWPDTFNAASGDHLDAHAKLVLALRRRLGQLARDVNEKHQQAVFAVSDQCATSFRAPILLGSKDADQVEVSSLLAHGRGKLASGLRKITSDDVVWLAYSKIRSNMGMGTIRAWLKRMNRAVEAGQMTRAEAIERFSLTKDEVQASLQGLLPGAGSRPLPPPQP